MLPPAPTGTRCTFGSDGTFGAQIGLAQEIDFIYQTIVIPSVTSTELNRDILNNIEIAMGDQALERIFDQCSLAAVSQSRMHQKRSQEIEHPWNWKGSVDSSGNRRMRSLRTLQGQDEMTGISIRPRDTVIEEGEILL